MNRFLAIERKLSKDSDFREQYASTIKEYFDLNHIAPAETSENQYLQFNSSNDPFYTCCTLPHHVVIKSDRLTTKCRVVFDASAETANGKTLNDLLCIGPVLQNEMAISQICYYGRY